MFYKTHNRSCDTQDKIDAAEYIENVGKVVAVNDTQYTTNFYYPLKSNPDYAVGSNFYSVNVVHESVANGGAKLVFPRRGSTPIMNVQSGKLYEDKNYSDTLKKTMGSYSKLCSVVCDATSDELTSPVSQGTNDFDFVTQELIAKGKSDREFFVLNDKAYFRERGKNKTPIMTADLGRELLRFSMMADYLDTEINVVGYDPVNSKSISSKTKAKTTESYSPVITPTPAQFFIDADADSEAKAKLRAKAIADRLQMQACFAEGEMVGL